MLYIPESDSCTVWTANNTPLQRDSETLYWFPSSANIDCWQVQSSRDGDTLTWYKHHCEQKSSGIVVFFLRVPCSLWEARHPLKCKSLLCQSIQGSPAHSPSTRRNPRSPLAKKPPSSALEGRVDEKTWNGVKLSFVPVLPVQCLASASRIMLKKMAHLSNVCMICIVIINRLVVR